jgi:23S rRNA pseudouridine1911/1915/1917 synthase
MASIRHPLVADVLYGGRCVAGAQRQMLHAHALSFIDPASDASVSFEAPLPPDFKAVMEQLSWDV